MRLGSAFDPVPPPERPPPPVDLTPLADLLAERIVAAILSIPAPQVIVPDLELPELAEMVNAVTGLKGPATAEEIGKAVARYLKIPAPADPTGVLAAVAEALEKLDFRLKGVGGPAFGSSGPSNISDNPDRLLGHVTVDSMPAGGAGLTDAELRAAPVPVSGTVAISNPTANPETGLAKDATLASILTELGQKLEAGQAVALDAATLAALESITVAGTVALDAPSLAALETVSVANFPATQAVSDVQPAAATHTAFVPSLANAVLIAANVDRKGLSVYNNNLTAALYLRFGGTAATTTVFTVKLVAGAYYELPRPFFTGAVQGIWDAATGNSAQVTELT